MAKRRCNRTKRNCTTDADAADSSSNRDGREPTVAQVDEHSSALLNKSQKQKSRKVNSGKIVKRRGKKTNLSKKKVSAVPRGIKQQVEVQKYKKGVVSTKIKTIDISAKKIATKVKKSNPTRRVVKIKVPRTKILRVNSVNSTVIQDLGNSHTQKNLKKKLKPRKVVKVKISTAKTGQGKKRTSKEKCLRNTSLSMETTGKTVTQCGQEKNGSFVHTSMDITTEQCAEKNVVKSKPKAKTISKPRKKTNDVQLASINKYDDKVSQYRSNVDITINEVAEGLCSSNLDAAIDEVAKGSCSSNVDAAINKVAKGSYPKTVFKIKLKRPPKNVVSAEQDFQLELGNTKQYDDKMAQRRSNWEAVIEEVAKGFCPTTGLDVKLERKPKPDFSFETKTKPNECNSFEKDLLTLIKLDNKKRKHKFKKNINGVASKPVEKHRHRKKALNTETKGEVKRLSIAEVKSLKADPEDSAPHQPISKQELTILNDEVTTNTINTKLVQCKASQSNYKGSGEFGHIREENVNQSQQVLSVKGTGKLNTKRKSSKTTDSKRDKKAKHNAKARRSSPTEELEPAKKKVKRSSTNKTPVPTIKRHSTTTEEDAPPELGIKKPKNFDNFKISRKTPQLNIEQKNIMVSSSISKEAIIYLEDISKNKHIKKMYNLKSSVNEGKDESGSSGTLKTSCTSKSLDKTSLASSKLPTSPAKRLRTSENSSPPQTKSRKRPALTNNCSSKDKGARGEIPRFIITCNVDTNSSSVKRILSVKGASDVLPQSSADWPEGDSNCSNDDSVSIENVGDALALRGDINFPDYDRISYEKYDLLWPASYTFCGEDTIRVLAYDNIFKDAVLSTECSILTEVDECSSSTVVDEYNHSTSTQKLPGPVLRRTVVNDCVDRKSAGHDRNQRSSSDFEEFHTQATSKQSACYRSTNSLNSEMEGIYATAPSVDQLHTEDTSKRRSRSMSNSSSFEIDREYNYIRAKNTRTVSTSSSENFELDQESACRTANSSRFTPSPRSMDQLHIQDTSKQSARYMSNNSLNSETENDIYGGTNTRDDLNISMNYSSNNPRVSPRALASYDARNVLKSRSSQRSNVSPLTTSNIALSFENSNATPVGVANETFQNKNTLFRVPLLPPAKRPPSRIPRNLDSIPDREIATSGLNVCSSLVSKPSGAKPSFSHSVTSSTTHKDNGILTSRPNVPTSTISKRSMTGSSYSRDIPPTTDDNDDILSLCAGSVFSLNLNPAEDDLRGSGDCLLDKGDHVLPEWSGRESPLSEQARLSEESRQALPDNWNENIEAPTTSGLTDEASELSRTSQELQHIVPSHVYDWVNDSLVTRINEVVQSPFNLADVPIIFRGICWFLWTRGNCRRKHCGKSHCILREMEAKITSLDYERLKQAYKFAIDRPLLYKELLNYFISAFKRLKLDFELFDMVGDILKFQNFNKTPFIIEIVVALETLDMSFEAAITLIIEKQGLETISDILLEVVFERKKDLCHNWCLVQKLTRFRKEPVDHGLIGEIMFECCLDNNEKLGSADNVKQLATNIVHDIIKRGLVNLQAIRISTCNAFLSTLHSLNFVAEEKILVEKMKSLGLHNINSPISQAVGDNRNSTHFLESSQLYRSDVRFSPLLSSPLLGFNNLHESPSQSIDNHSTSDIVSEPGQNTPRLNYSNESELQNTNLQNTDFDFDKSSNPAKSLTPQSQSHDNAIVEGSKSQQIVSNSNGDDLDYEYSCFENDDMNEDQNDTPVLVGSVPLAEFSQNIEKKTTRMCDELNSGACSTPSRSTHDVVENEVLLPEADVLRLKVIIRKGESLNFLLMIGKFINTGCSRSFILHTLCCFKTKKPEETYKLFMEVLNGIEHMNSCFTNDAHMKTMLEMLAINIVGILANRNAYKEAASVLQKFPDFDSLKATNWFESIHSRACTECGKYLYFCKIFIKGGFVKEAWNILVSRKWMLQSPDTWQLEWKDPYDISFRDYVVRSLITTSLGTDLRFAKDVILSLIESNISLVADIDPWKYFNQLLTKMLDGGESYVVDLVGMMSKILNGWFKNLEKSVMRGLLVVLLPVVNDEQAMKLYDVCARQHFYPNITGKETTIDLKTDMTIEEIYMTLRVFFNKVVKNNFTLHDILLRIRLPERSPNHPRVLSVNRNVSVQELKSRICEVLAKGFDFIINVRNNCPEPQIVVQADQMQPCIDFYRTVYRPRNFCSEQRCEQCFAFSKMTDSKPT